MALGNRVGTGLAGFDTVIDRLRLGDNVVWQVRSVDEYRRVAEPFARQALADGRKVLYVRFGRHAPLLEDGQVTATHCLVASGGFESFASAVHSLIEAEGREMFYVFDCLTDLLQDWYSDLMIGNFFRLTCPFLYELETVAYFTIIRNAHTYDTIARIRETTQVLLDVHSVDEDFYIHPLKARERYSPTMFFPHLILGDEAVSVTASAQAAQLFAARDWDRPPQDYWEQMLDQARAALAEDAPSREWARDLLITLILGREPRMRELCREHFSLQDLLDIAGREIGTGLIGGKSVGMLLARKILENEARELVRDHWEPHDSFYLGADIYYTYIVQNGWWNLRMRQKTPEGYFPLAPELREKLLAGRFPQVIRERFTRMLEHFGQSPIIVRSSSLLEDSYGHAFAGKYESVFLANQGPPEERYRAFEQAVREVYASAMNDDALAYRLHRGLVDRDEQMAILVQRVSGDHYGDWFFPHLAGVGNSANLYVWDKDLDPGAGMLRLVLGLGTRAVDRTSGDYARLVALDAPAKAPPVTPGDERRYAQHRADVIDLRENRLAEVPVDRLAGLDLGTDPELFFSPDREAERRLREAGLMGTPVPLLPDCRQLLADTDFPALARGVLSSLARAYAYPVDIEFTANFTEGGGCTFNLLQCRPLQTKGLGQTVTLPEINPAAVFFAAEGGFMGGNARLDFDYVILIKAREYLNLPRTRQYETARLVGGLNQALRDRRVLLLGPGRWGTTTPSLGVPVHFTELSRMAAVVEYADPEAGAAPDLSFGSHFFQDIVESDIFYVALFGDRPGTVFRPGLILDRANRLADWVTVPAPLDGVIHLAESAGLRLYADVVSQRVLCCAGE